MKKLPIGLQDFRGLREGGYLYIDKTPYIYRLIESGKYYFLSRPRRFGKSLTLSTIKELFRGSRELFDGLWVADQWGWTEQYPVVHISFSSIGYQQHGLEKAIDIMLEQQAETFQIKFEREGISLRFRELLEKLAARNNKVVLLIDEYDKPLIDYLHDLDRALEHQKILKSFYSIIKDSDPYLRFLLVTGVSKFTKVSIFSDLNNLQDITVHPAYNELCGYTQLELEHYFEDRVQGICRQKGIEKGALLNQIKEWYNGYSWSGDSFLYNPFSILSYFSAIRFQNFWFATGTPTFLIELLKERRFYKIEKIKVSPIIFESYTLDNLESHSLLFQTGYLTVKDVDEFGLITLDYPNKEVRDAMYSYLIGAFRQEEPSLSTPMVVQLRHAFVANDLEQVISIIKTLFKNIPSQIFIAQAEAYYHSLIYLTFRYLGVYIESEVNESDARLDAVVQTDTRIYIFEFKLDRSADEALDQIREKGYADKYRHEDKTIVGVGVNFSSEDKTVGEWRVEGV